jgi:CheY-like chemotaxis protein
VLIRPPGDASKAEDYSAAASPCNPKSGAGRAAGPRRGHNTGVGSEKEQTLPRRTAIASQDSTARRLLLVDDNADAAETLGELLGLMGYEVRVAGDAHAALAVLDDFHPELALLDIGLPEIDGYQLAGMLRADPRAAGTKLVALTGYSADSQRGANFDEHLVKPVAPDKLLEVVGRLLG